VGNLRTVAASRTCAAVSPARAQKPKHLARQSEGVRLQPGRALERDYPSRKSYAALYARYQSRVRLSPGKCPER